MAKDERVKNALDSIERILRSVGGAELTDQERRLIGGALRAKWRVRSEVDD